MLLKPKNIFLLLCLSAGFIACRTHKPVTTETGMLYSSCYPIESITIPHCKLSIKDGNKSYQLNGSIYIRPDSVFYFRGTVMGVEMVRGVIYHDSFAIINRWDRICFKGNNQYLSNLTGYPINPEILFLLFTADRCEEAYKEKLGFRVTSGQTSQVMVLGSNRSTLEMKFNPENSTTESITSYKQQTGFKATYGQYQQFQQFLLPTVLDISASGGGSNIQINTTYQEILFDQPQSINFSIPSGYQIQELK